MSMTVVVTSNVPERFRGFLASCMLEIAPGVYTAPQMTRGVRERIWKVCVEWTLETSHDGCIVLTWSEANEPSGLGVRILGAPAKTLQEADGVWLVKREVPDDTVPF